MKRWATTESRASAVAARQKKILAAKTARQTRKRTLVDLVLDQLRMQGADRPARAFVAVLPFDPTLDLRHVPDHGVRRARHAAREPLERPVDVDLYGAEPARRHAHLLPADHLRRALVLDAKGALVRGRVLVDHRPARAHREREFQQSHRADDI